MASKTTPPKRAEQRRAALHAALNRAADLYYNDGTPEIEDSEYDDLYRELVALEAEHPSLVSPDSPTQRVGAPLPKGSTFEKADHLAPMLSIESLTGSDEVVEFVTRARKYLGIVDPSADDEDGADVDGDSPATADATPPKKSKAKKSASKKVASKKAASKDVTDAAEEAELPPPPPPPTWHWAVEPKLDGVSANLLYEDGVLVRGLSRGDGRTGEDITRNLKTIRNLPLRLQVEDPPSRIEVRGEVIMARDAFAVLQKESEAVSDTPFRNARNTVAGSLKLLDPGVVATRKIEFLCFGVGQVEGLEHASHSERRDFLRACGFKLAEPYQVVEDADGILAYHHDLEQRREELPYDLDGIVAKVDDVALQRRLGRTARAPRWTLAYKFAPRKAQTRVEAIQSQVGRTGVITPVANLEPVDLAGVTVARATLHNWGLLQKKDVRPGDTVTIERAGDVIPAVVSVDVTKRDPSSKPVDTPTKCPACASVLEPEGAFVYCVNIDCTEQLRGRLVHMASRRALDMRKLGDKQIDQLVDAGIVQHFEDVFGLDTRREEILDLDRWGEKSFDNLVEQIEKAKHPTMPKLLYAIGIRHVGEQTAKDLAEVFDTLEKLQNASEDDLVDVHGVGPEVAQSIRAFFEREQTTRLLGALQEHGVEVQHLEAKASEGEHGATLAGMTFCFTGGMTRMSRDEARALVEDRGAKTSSSVTKKVTHVVAGDGAGSKLDKAKKLELEIFSEDEFAAFVGLDS